MVVLDDENSGHVIFVHSVELALRHGADVIGFICFCLLSLVFQHSRTV